MRRLVLAFVVVLLSVSGARAYDERDYCLDVAVADRLACTAEKLRLRSDCLDYRAFDRWAGFDTADEDYASCVQDALDDWQWCRGQIDSCQEE